jgi:4-aminobutyrate aminotransferase / (S)-3-amino-2-methylpropionate transaminase / 5-aminovalerate transaminase
MEKGAYFLDGLKQLQARHRAIGDVDGLGLALRIEVCREDGYTPDKATLDWMCDEAMRGELLVGAEKYGLVLDVGGYHKNVITLAPSLLITRSEIDLALTLLDQLFQRAATR